MTTRGSLRRVGVALLGVLLLACGEEPEGTVITFPGSAVGEEARVLERQLGRFMEQNPGIRVVQRRTPDAADQRHQLYVQWLNAQASDPDILQLDVIWTPEFAAAGWILPLQRFGPEEDAFFESTLRANRWWEGELYALPWFVDVGMLYWRSDLMDEPPATFEEMASRADSLKSARDLPYGAVWQGARYEGLVTVFLEHLRGFGGRILGEDGEVLVDSETAVRTLEFMRDAIYERGYVPREVLTWHEEETRFAFQNGQAVFMRNWPYAVSLLQDSSASEVAGRFSVAPMPAAPGGRRTAALGGSQLAINANTEHPEAAWKLIDFLTRPEQMLERARIAGQYPTRKALYDDPSLADALPLPVDRAREIIERAVPRPVTPVYSQLSGILQVRLHRALTRQESPESALRRAAEEIRTLLERTGLEELDRSAPPPEVQS